MPLSDLVETECGGNNSLTQFTSHYISDKGFAEEGIQHPFQNLKVIFKHFIALYFI